MVTEHNQIDPALLNAIDPLDPMAGSLVMPRPKTRGNAPPEPRDGTPETEGEVTMPYKRYGMTTLYNNETGRVYEVYGQVAIEALRAEPRGKNKWLPNGEPLYSIEPGKSIMYPQTGEGKMCPLYKGDDNEQKQHFIGQGLPARLQTR